jgi:hypothetical protein
MLKYDKKINSVYTFRSNSINMELHIQKEEVRNDGINHTFKGKR